jgi:hypothetical protein
LIEQGFPPMNDLVQPDWLKNHTATGAPGNPGWKKGMPSPNPAGRPKGSLSKSDKIARVLNDEGPEVVRIVLDAAKAGDMTACGHILNRLVPALRSQSEKVQFSFDPSLPIARQVEQVLAAVASGEVPPDVGQTIVAMISNLANVRATEELAERLTLLEAKAVNE